MINKELILTSEHLKECLDYNPETGLLIWKKRPVSHFTGNLDIAASTCNRTNLRCCGKEAGWNQKNNNSGKYYRAVHLIGFSYMAHRVIWFYMTGEWPIEIDHDDGNGLNNKWDNLSNVVGAKNQKNKKLYSCNKSGISGVYRKINRWNVVIRHNSHLKHIGSFIDFFEACCARKSAENRYEFHNNHGQIRPL